MRYEHYKAMQDIREIKFRDSGSYTNTKICFKARALLYVSAFTQKNFHYIHTGPPTKGTSTEEFAITNLEYTTPLSNTTPLHKRQSTKRKLNHLYTRGMGTKLNYNHNHLYTRGIGTKAKHNHLYTRGTRHKAKPQPQLPLHKRDRH